MTQQEFNNLDGLDPKLNEIYRILPKPTAPGESPISGLFGSGRVVHDRPEYTPPQGPVDFENVFGSYPGENFGSSSNAQWKKDLARWEGSIDLTSDSTYMFKASQSMGAGLGVPLAYTFDGKEYITFSAFKGKRWRRLLDNFTYSTNWNTLLNTATMANR